MKKILIVDDDEGPLSALQEALEAYYTIVAAQTLNSAISILESKERAIDMVITDYHLGKSGTANDLIHHIKTHMYLKVRNLPILVITADKSQKYFIETQNCEFMTKPFKLAQLLESIKNKIGE
jgi:DNA-binding NtrC family response regulator